jgi:hypothetical protein
MNCSLERIIPFGNKQVDLKLVILYTVQIKLVEKFLPERDILQTG